MKYIKQTLLMDEGEFEAPEGYYLFSAQRGEKKVYEYTIWITKPVWDIVWAPIEVALAPNA